MASRQKRRKPMLKFSSSRKIHNIHDLSNGVNADIFNSSCQLFFHRDTCNKPVRSKPGRIRFGLSFLLGPLYTAVEQWDEVSTMKCAHGEISEDNWDLHDYKMHRSASAHIILLILLNITLSAVCWTGCWASDGSCLRVQYCNFAYFQALVALYLKWKRKV